MNNNIIGITFSFIKKSFLCGFFFLLPIIITIIAIRFFINFLSQLLQPLNYLLPFKIHPLFYTEIIIAFVLIFSTGIIIDYFLSDVILLTENIVIKNIPFLGSLYFSIKRIMGVIYQKDSTVINQYERVAWVRVPAKNMYCLGLMTNKVDSKLAPDQEKEYFCFFVPHTPNPISGYYLVASIDECVFTNISRQDALSMIMSAGVIQPLDS